MKLYYSPGACSLAARIALLEAGLPFEAVRVDLKAHTLQDGRDYYSISPKGYVPLLELDDGERLTENPPILQYLADHVPASHLAPANGTMARYRLQEWLNFTATELHKSFSPLFSPATPEETRALMRDKIILRLRWVDSQLVGKHYLMGDTFTVADIYLFVITRWSSHFQLDLGSLEHLNAYMARMDARPAVQTALQADAS